MDQHGNHHMYPHPHGAATIGPGGLSSTPAHARQGSQSMVISSLPT